MINFFKNMLGKKGGSFKTMRADGTRMSAHAFFTDITKEEQKPVFDEAMRGVAHDQKDIIERYNKKFGKAY